MGSGAESSEAEDFLPSSQPVLTPILCTYITYGSVAVRKFHLLHLVK